MKELFWVFSVEFRDFRCVEAIFANSAAVFRGLFEGLKDHLNRPNIHQTDANLISFDHVLEFLKSISRELNAEVGKVRHQKLPKKPKALLMQEGFFSFLLLFFYPHYMDP